MIQLKCASLCGECPLQIWLEIDLQTGEFALMLPQRYALGPRSGNECLSSKKTQDIRVIIPTTQRKKAN